MRELAIAGSLDDGIYYFVKKHPNSVYDIVHQLIERYLPSLEEKEVFSAVCLSDSYSEGIIRLKASQMTNIVKIAGFKSALKTTNRIILNNRTLITPDHTRIAKKVIKKPDRPIAVVRDRGSAKESIFSISRLYNEENRINSEQNIFAEYPDSTFHNLEESIESALTALPEREMEIVVKCEGLLPGAQSITFADIARKLGISRERARQLHNRAMRLVSNSITETAIMKFAISVNILLENFSGSINMFDFQRIIPDRSSFQKYDPLACIQLMLSFIGLKIVFQGNFLNFESSSDCSQPSASGIRDSFQLLEWFYGIGQHEIDYLNGHYGLFSDVQHILSCSISSSMWSKLSRKEIIDYLKASLLFPSVLSKWNTVTDAVIDCGGAISTDDAFDIIECAFDIIGLHRQGILILLSEMLGGITYDSNHFLWVAEGFSWQDNKKFQLTDNDNYPIDGKNISQTNAAHKILLENGSPMLYDDIVRIALEREYIKTKAKDPAGGLRTLIYFEIQKDNELGRDSRFELLKGGFLGLTGEGLGFYEGDNRTRRTFAGRIPYSDLAYSVLKSNGGAMHFTEIYDALQENSDEPLNVNTTAEGIQNALKREEASDDSRFVEIEEGRWALSFFARSKKTDPSLSQSPESMALGNRESEKSTKDKKTLFLDFLGLNTKG
jgi:DNA-directed RNA polymerase delta subunit